MSSRPLKETSNQPANPVTGGAPFFSGKEKSVSPRPLVSSRVHVRKSSSGRGGKRDWASVAGLEIRVANSSDSGGGRDEEGGRGHR